MVTVFDDLSFHFINKQFIKPFNDLAVKMCSPIKGATVKGLSKEMFPHGLWSFVGHLHTNNQILTSDSSDNYFKLKSPIIHVQIKVILTLTSCTKFALQVRIKKIRPLGVIFTLLYFFH